MHLNLICLWPEEMGPTRNANPSYCCYKNQVNRRLASFLVHLPSLSESASTQQIVAAMVLSLLKPLFLLISVCVFFSLCFYLLFCSNLLSPLNAWISWIVETTFANPWNLFGVQTIICSDFHIKLPFFLICLHACVLSHLLVECKLWYLLHQGWCNVFYSPFSNAFFPDR